jgi:hypothetical protein
MFALLGEIFKPQEVQEDNFFFKLIIASISSIIIWEGNLRIDHWLNINYPWLKDTRKRLLIQLLVSPLFTVLLLIVLLNAAHLILEQPNRAQDNRFDPLFIPGISVAFFIHTIDIGNHFFKSWKESLIEVEKYKTESANAQLQNLKSQLNPHFLFNNLSVLTSLIYKSQDKAVDFINELSKVYRYVLDNKNAELVTLQHELKFLNHYIYLLKIRFEDSVSFNINIDENNLLKYLPPICLQMLVENTIQHNEASQAKPLQVNIYTNNDTLIIENNIQARSDFAESSKTGLENLQARYSFFTERKVVISKNDNIFKVALPLIISQ